MKNLKNLSIPSYLLPIAAVAYVIAMIIAIVSCTGEGFGMANLPWVAVLTVAAVLLCGGALLLASKRGDKTLSSLSVILMVAALSACVYLMIYGKADVFGTVIFSDLEKGYAPAERASGLGLTSIIFYLVSLALVMVASFFRLNKKAENQ